MLATIFPQSTSLFINDPQSSKILTTLKCDQGWPLYPRAAEREEKLIITQKQESTSYNY